MDPRESRFRIESEGLKVMIYRDLGDGIESARRLGRDAFPTLFHEKAPLWVFSVCRHFLVYDFRNPMNKLGKSDIWIRSAGTSGTVYGNLAGAWIRFTGFFGSALREPRLEKVTDIGNRADRRTERCQFPGISSRGRERSGPKGAGFRYSPDGIKTKDGDGRMTRRT